MRRVCLPFALSLVLVSISGSCSYARAQAASTSHSHAAPRRSGAITSGYTLHVEPDENTSWIYTLVNGAKKNIDMTMYELIDTTFSGDLVAACQRGVKVRVILDQSLERTYNTPAFDQINAAPNCSAVWSNTAFQATHQKSMVIDGATLVIMTFNLTSRYYPTSRDFGMVYKDAKDVSAVELTFNADYKAGTPSGGTAGASDFSYVPSAGDDLIWSPTSAQADLLGIVDGAKKSLLLENEELGATNIVSALEAACKRGVAVNIAMTDTSTYYHANYTALQKAGCGVHIGPYTSTGFYVHAKSIIADYGLSTQKAYIGSINFSVASMTKNRELGMFLKDVASIKKIHTAMSADYAKFPAFQ